MDARMQRAIERFPQLATTIQERFYDDRRLQEICADYTEALETLKRWEASQDAQRISRIAEYRELVDELATEILAAVRLPVQDVKDDPK
jgi:hypothetical protein